MLLMANPRTVFFNDIIDDATAQRWADALAPSYYLGRGPVISSEDWRQASITVLLMRQDQAVPPERLEAIWQDVEKVWLDLGHSAFVGHPDTVADVLVRAAQG